MGTGTSNPERAGSFGSGSVEGEAEGIRQRKLGERETACRGGPCRQNPEGLGSH